MAANFMGDKYFVGVGGEPRGPIELWEVLGLFKQGTINRETPLLMEGWKEWGKVGDLNETLAPKEPKKVSGGWGTVPPDKGPPFNWEAFWDFKLAPSKPGEHLAWLCFFCFAGGIVGVLYFCFGFEVAHDGIANLDAMNLRLLGVLVSVGMIILGGLFLVVRQLVLLRAEKKR